MARVRYVSFKSFNVIVLVEKDMRGFHLACGMGHINRSWRISKTPNTTKFFFYHFETYTASYNGHSELSREEKSKFEFEEKKLCLLLKVAFSRQKRLQTSLFSNKLNFFSSNSNFDFSSRDDSE